MTRKVYRTVKIYLKDKLPEDPVVIELIDSVSFKDNMCSVHHWIDGISHISSYPQERIWFVEQTAYSEKGE